MFVSQLRRFSKQIQFSSNPQQTWKGYLYIHGQ